MSAARVTESTLVLLPARLVLASVFGVAAVMKLDDPQAFAFAIKAFRIFDPETQDHVLVMLSFGIPWTELLVAVLLLFGFWTRSAALLLGLLLAGFSAGLVSVITRGISTDCSCFGGSEPIDCSAAGQPLGTLCTIVTWLPNLLNRICGDAVGWCQVARNAVLLLLSLLLVWRGGGVLALDALCRGGRADRRENSELDIDDDEA